MGAKKNLNRARKRIWEGRQKEDGVIKVELTPLQRLNRQELAKNNWKMIRR